jgi:Kef-type K+ transport system membrane component KefB
MKILGSRVATTVSGAATLSGLLSILLMIAAQATNYAATYGAFKMTIAVSWFLAKLIMLFAVAYFLISRFLRLSSKAGFPKRPRQMLIGYLLLVASLYAWAALHFGSFAAVGVASLGGVLLGTSNLEVKKRIAKRFESILTSIPVGILLMVMGMQVNFKEARTYFPFLAGVFIIVVGAKLAGSWIATRKEFDSVSERLSIMIGVLPQGEVGLLIAGFLFSRGLLNPSSFNVAIIAVVVLTMVAPVVMRFASANLDALRASAAIADSER